MEIFKFFRQSLLFTLIGLIFGFFVGYEYSGTLTGGFQAMFLAFVLCVLEISLSFDNAVVNASVLNQMTPVWRHRFLTWGILIAVFGMRIVFPLAIVSILAQVSPWAALMMATFEPAEYSRIMLSSHVALSGFGGSFLMMVALAFFFDEEKDAHWFRKIESLLARLGKIAAAEIGICLIILYFLSRLLAPEEQMTFVGAGIWGLLTFIIVDGIATFLKVPNQAQQSMHKASAAMFVYLEILDASFSFDGVIGAFALTNNLFIIAIGLGIGALFVRSMTIYLVEKKTLEQFAYLEHGAFYAIGALAAIMLLDPFFHIHEVFTGFVGAVLIGLSILDSIRFAKRGSRNPSQPA